MKLEDVCPIDDLSASQFKEFMDNRGGCRCFLSPPCHACVEPPTLEELEAIGFEVDPE